MVLLDDDLVMNPMLILYSHFYLFEKAIEDPNRGLNGKLIFHMFHFVNESQIIINMESFARVTDSHQVK